MMPLCFSSYTSVSHVFFPLCGCIGGAKNLGIWEAMKDNSDASSKKGENKADLQVESC